MRVRNATLADVPRLVELMRANATAAQWSEQQFAKMVEEGDRWRVILVVEADLRAESTGAVAEERIPRFARNDNRTGPGKPLRDADDARVEAFAVAKRIEPECEIENIIVNPERQRRGLGERLLGELLNCLRGKACEAVFLEVRESNLPARGLYEKFGFREVGRRVKYYVQPQEDAVVYRFCWTSIASGMVQT
jgi:ribosomal-protein-alanine acetyltransferase